MRRSSVRTRHTETSRGRLRLNPSGRCVHGFAEGELICLWVGNAGLMLLWLWII